MFKPLERSGKSLGFIYEVNNLAFVFGSRQLPRSALTSVFPHWRFSFMKQVHGRTVIEAQPEQALEADAQFTQSPNLALVAQSADCVPVLLASRNRVCAIHSGWRGCALNIVAATRSVFLNEPVLYAAIGPHIMRASFEVGSDVANQLQAACPQDQPQEGLSFPHRETGKAYFDLTELVRRQITSAFGPKTHILSCLADTMTDLNFHSFRRDRERAERQYSFVVINR